jgi:hypothetical protein
MSTIGHNRQFNIIETSCPLSMETLKEYFQDKENTSFLINYREGKLDADALMIYLSNLNLDADFDEATYDDREALKEIVLAYMKTTTSLLSIEQLSREALAICCQHRNVLAPEQIGNDDELCEDPDAKFKYYERLGDASDFIKENNDIVERWCVMLDSSAVFNIHCVSDPFFDEFVKENFETIDDPDYVGINYVNTYSLPWIGYYIGSIGPLGHRPAKYFNNQFNEYRFKGRNMHHYFNTEANVLSVMSHVIAAGEWDNITTEELK